MRKHLYLITEHPDDELVGNVESRSGRYPRAKKNEERPIDKRNIETGETWEERVVGLGYHDFEDEAAYEDTENFAEVVQDKLGEIDAEHLEAAGLTPSEVAA